MEWPSPEEEEWRRTDLSEIDFDRFEPYAALNREAAGESEATESTVGEHTPTDDPVAESSSGLRPAVTRPSIDSAAYAGFSGGKSVRLDTGEIDGALIFDLDDLAGGPDDSGNEKHVLRAVELLEKASKATVAGIDNRIQAWHYGSAKHGVVLYVPANTRIERPIVIDFEETGRGTLSNPYVAVLLDTGAEATVLQIVRSGYNTDLLCNLGLDAHVGDNASLRLFTMQDIGINDTYFQHKRIRIDRDARLMHFEAFFGGALSKARTEVELSGTGGDAAIDGIYFADGNRHMDIRTVQYHRAQQTSSRAFFKGAVRDAGRSVYQGMIEVDPSGHGTDAYLSNKNLVLNEGARADSIPSLKINTNDVKCSHGSTTGRINPEEVFYLMSRGFPEKVAKNELIVAFFEDAIRVVPESFSAIYSDRIWNAVRSQQSISRNGDG